MDQSETSQRLAYAAPSAPAAQLLLFAIRRMAAGGLTDAHAATAMMSAFGLGFRRPLILLRAFMAEVSRVSAVRILVAPCCCRRMTGDEMVILESVAGALARPRAAHDAFRGLLHIHSCLGLLTSAQAVSAGFADMGLPLSSLADA